MIMPISYNSDVIFLLDQTKIPYEETHIKVTTVPELYDAIKSLKIRGAPLIGIAAAYGMRLSSAKNLKYDIATYKKNLIADLNLLKSSRPTAVNLFNVLSDIENLIKLEEDKYELNKSIINFAEKTHKNDKEMCEKIAKHGVKLVKNNAKILTHCNTGALATGGIGTALGVIYRSYWDGKNPEVFVGETRPLLQGARLTAFELIREGIRTHILPDSARSYLMANVGIDLVITGADRIAMNGDTANKIGTFDIAINAMYFGIPLYIAAPSSTFDKNAMSAKDIPIECRSAEELYRIGYEGLKDSGVIFENPAFDITPNGLISGIITERGVIFPPYEKNIPDFI